MAMKVICDNTADTEGKSKDGEGGEERGNFVYSQPHRSKKKLE